MWLLDRIPGWRRPKGAAVAAPLRPVRGRVDHVVILDGTLSSLEPGQETNAGLAWRLLTRAPDRAHLTVFYESGIQWEGWRQAGDVIAGRGINRQIQRAYGHLASRYRPGDRIFLFGYSRGAYAARSLGGVIDRVGLVRAQDATARTVLTAYRHYQAGATSAAAAAFSRAHCHPGVEIELIAVWDTVKALGLRLPFLWKLTEPAHSFHDHGLGPSIRAGRQALALHETRVAFAPVMWTDADGADGRVVQMWFRGAHGDIGGHLGGFDAARPLSNVPFVWMLEEAARAGLVLPDGWRAAFPCDATVPMVGTNRSWGKYFVYRRRRRVGRYASEAVHPTAKAVLKRGRRTRRAAETAAP